MNENILEQYAKENPRRDVAVVGLRDEEGNVLLMRSHKLPELWQPIGGGIDREDASPAAAAVRELQEELGLNIDPSALEEVLTTPYDFGEGTVYFFETRVYRDNLVLHVQTNEVVEHRWFSRQELNSLPAMPATQIYLKLITK
jgi:8-oxo-dGTP pyrophosphatase MutT (NUDIX family)